MSLIKNRKTNDFYDPKGVFNGQIKHANEDDFIVERDDNRFLIGQPYEEKAVNTVYCKHCGGDKFNIGKGDCYTAIKCVNCEWEICIHEG